MRYSHDWTLQRFWPERTAREAGGGGGGSGAGVRGEAGKGSRR